MVAEKKEFLINADLTIKQAMKKMSDIGQKNIFIIDGNNRLIGSISDGDIRRWILSGGSINERVSRTANKKPKYAKENYKIADIKHLMLTLSIENVPVVNKSKEVVDVLTWGCVFSNGQPKQRAKIKIPVVIMAGGKGVRLDPFTKILPKPLIPINDKPIIEIIMDKFSEYGVNEYFLTVNHKARMIKFYFDDAEKKHKIHYIEEEKPLGTAGGLRFLKNKVKDSFIVTNCDTIIETDYAEIVNFHKSNKYDMTLVVSCKHYIIPYGVCIIENNGILERIDEKPELDFLVSTGMYVMNKNILDLIPRNKVFDINDFIKELPIKGLKVGVFPISENAWIDIGQWEEYRKAIEKMRMD
jgi:dTDP-glucose pyrophosphorylase